MITGILYRFVNKRICIGKVKNENLRIVFEVLELKKFRNVFMLAIGGRINVLRRMFTAARFGVTLRSNSIEVVSRLLLNSRGFLLGQMNIAPVWPPATLHFCLSFSLISSSFFFSRNSLKSVRRDWKIFFLPLLLAHLFPRIVRKPGEKISRTMSDVYFFLKNIWGALSLWCGWWATSSTVGRTLHSFRPERKRLCKFTICTTYSIEELAWIGVENFMIYIAQILICFLQV